MEELTEAQRDLYEKIAKLSFQGVAEGQIALACGLKESDVLSIQGLEEYQKLAAPIVSEFVEAQITVNQGWDAVEEKALATVVTHLQHNKDPDFALRAAMVANKSVKRGAGNRHQQSPLAMQAGARVVINLETNFVQQIGQMQTRKRDFSMITVEEKKAVNMLSTADVNKMLDGPLELDPAAIAKIVNG